MLALEVLDIIKGWDEACNIIGSYQWRSNISHFRLDKIPQLTILGKKPRIAKYAENGGMVNVNVEGLVSTGIEHQ